MITIHKFVLEQKNVQTVSIKGLIRVLSVESQNDDIVLYCAVDNLHRISKNRTLHIIPTGGDAACLLGVRQDFLGTVKLRDGALMFHVFVENK